MSFNVEYNIKEINLIILENILKMLKRRKLIDDVDSELKKIDINKSIIEILLNNKNYYHVYILSFKIMSIVQGTPLDDFLSNNIDIHKIVIGKNVAKKVVKQILYEYKNSEFFFEHEMLEDIPNKIFIPEHILLNDNEKKQLLSKFTENELSSILDIDIMSRYYYAKVGDIFKIIRPSIVAGNSIVYRKVIYGSLDLLFG